MGAITSTEPTPELYTALCEAAKNEGFPLFGAVDIDLAFQSGQFLPHVEHYDRWLAAGHAGAMDYLVRGRDRRADPRLVFPEAQAVFCVAIPYHRRPAGAAEEETGPRYARYLQGVPGSVQPGRDYHEELLERLELVMLKAAEPFRQGDTPLKWKICVDTSAVLERAWASLAGLGWIGRNTLLIHPKLGSYLFLAEALINRPTGRAPAPMPSLCGHCGKCLEFCPGKAILETKLGEKNASHVDSNRCISYQTLEKRGELTIGEAGRKAVDRWVAGCDVCQEVCPYNIRPQRQELEQERQLVGQGLLDPPGDATRLQEWLVLLEETPEQYKARVKHSALNRVKPTQFSRNLAITLANCLPGLISSRQPDIDRLRTAIEQRLQAETDPLTRTEWLRCRDRLQTPG